MQTLALAVGDALSCTSDTEAMSVTTSTGEFKAELRIAPVLGIEEPGSVEQEQGDQQLENSAAKPKAHTSTTREGNSGRAVADQQDGRSTHDCEAQGRQDQVSSAANDGEAHDSGEGGEQASPIILQAFSEVSQFQVHGGEPVNYPDVRVPLLSLALVPHLGDASPRMSASEIAVRDGLEEALGSRGGVTSIASKTLTVADELGIIRRRPGTFLVELSTLEHVEAAAGMFVKAGKQVFVLEPITSESTTWLCRDVPLDQNGISKTSLVCSLLAYFHPEIALRVSIACHPERTDKADILVQTSNPVNYEWMAFDVGGYEMNAPRHKLQFRPLDRHGHYRCIECSSNEHRTTECPRFWSCVLEKDLVREPRLVETLEELRDARWHSTDDDDYDPASGLDELSAMANATPDIPHRPKSATHEPLLSLAQIPKTPTMRSGDPAVSLPAPQPPLILQGHCHTDASAPPYVVRNGSSVASPFSRSARKILMVNATQGGNGVPTKGRVRSGLNKLSTTDGTSLERLIESVTVISGVRCAKFRTVDIANKAIGLHLNLNHETFRLDPFVPTMHASFACRNIPFSSDGVGRVPALHSILALIPGRVCVKLRQQPGGNSTGWTGDLLVMCEEPQLKQSFSFDLEVRRNNASDFRLCFMPEAESGKACPWCDGSSGPHAAQKCPEMVSLLLDDGRGSHA